MPRFRSHILYRPNNTNLSCRARTHCNDCTIVEDGAVPPYCNNNVQIFNNNIDKFKDGDKFIINLDCCHDTCNTCNTHDCCCVDPVIPKKCCNNPCHDGSLPRLTKCEIKQKSQQQHNLTLINPCQTIYPKPCNDGQKQVKGYNKRYSFNDQLLILNSHAYDRSVYNCTTSRIVRGNPYTVNGVSYRSRGVECIHKANTCPTNSCF